jgi:hypothetical protein
MPEGKEKEAAKKQFFDNGENGAQRITVKKLMDKTAMIALSDTMGRARIKMSVAPDGTPKLDFLDEAGKVVFSLPDKAVSKEKTE